MVAGLNNAALPEGLTLGASRGGYRIVKKIAVGGSSMVYLAHDGQQREVALKEYLPAALAKREAGQLEPTVTAEHAELYRLGMKFFFDEGRALSAIVHPMIGIMIPL